MSALVEHPEPHIKEVYPGTDQLKYDDYDEYLRDARAWDRDQLIREIRTQNEGLKTFVNGSEWRIFGCIIMAATSHFWIGLAVFLSPELFHLAALWLKRYLKERTKRAR